MTGSRSPTLYHLYPPPINAGRPHFVVVRFLSDAGAGGRASGGGVEQHGSIPILVEYSNAVVPVAQALWGEDRIHYADFTDGFRPPKFDAVIDNPPYGKVFGHADAALRQRFVVLNEKELPPDTFKSLTNIATTLYVLSVAQDGPLAQEVRAWPASQVVGNAVSAETGLTTINTDVGDDDDRPRAASLAGW